MRFSCVHTKSWSFLTPLSTSALLLRRWRHSSTSSARTAAVVDKVDIWGRRRLAYEIAKHAEGIYAVVDVKAEPATVSELDRQLNLNESVLRTKVLRTDKH